MAKPSYTPAQAAAAITSLNYSWSSPLGNSVPVTYGFRAVAPPDSYSVAQEGRTFTAVNGAERDAANASLREWASVANITFVPVNQSGETNQATMLFGNYRGPLTDGKADSTAHAYFPETKNTAPESLEGDVWFNLSDNSFAALPLGSYNFSTALHEIGHAIGLQHPGDYNAAPGVRLTYEKDAVYAQDTLQYSVMSYFEAFNSGATHAFNGTTIYTSTPLRDDIAAIQRLYGANMTTRTGDTTYGFNNNTGDPAFELAVNKQGVFSIWDAGGRNTIDLSGFNTNQQIDLHQGAFSNAGALTGNISIAIGTLVQNAIGGGGNDYILGNGTDNMLRGNAGNDTIIGDIGQNTSVYAGAAKNYEVSINYRDSLSGFTIRDKVGSDGLDSLTRIQALKFADQTMSVTDFAKVEELVSTSIMKVVDLYIAAYNRAPDTLGLLYWAGRAQDGMSVVQMANSFFVQSEAQSLYPSTLSTQDLVNAVYLNIFKRPADAAGLSYWASQLDSGATSRGAFLTNVMAGALGPDGVVRTNKEAVAGHFALTQGLTNLGWARTVMAGVDASAASVTAANQQADNFAAIAAVPETTELVIKVVGVVS